LIRAASKPQAAGEDQRGYYPRLADEDLMSLVGAGDAFAFTAFYDRHFRATYSLARRLTGGDEHDAEDLAQDAFLKVWRSASSYRAERGSVRKWMLSVVRNQGIDRLRSKASHLRTQEQAEAESPRAQPSEDFDLTWRNSRRDRVRKALQDLPDTQYKVLALAHFSDLTHAEIAERLCLPLGTVKGRVRLGLKKLRGCPELRRMVDG
jgi:RNA polymerase sigma-70 factor (ECF subfamily)